MTGPTIEVTLMDGRKETVADVERVDMKDKLVVFVDGKKVLAVAAGNWQSWKVIDDNVPTGVVEVEGVSALVLAYVFAHPGCSTQEVRAGVGRKTASVDRALRELQERNIIRAVGSPMAVTRYVAAS